MALLSLAVALSLDAFSVALSIGLLDSNKNKHLLFSLLVGVFHFIMPLFGTITNKVVLKNIIINGNRLLGAILLILAIEMILDLKNKNEITIKINYILLSLTVSIDSYFTGIGLGSFNGINPVKFFLFSATSFCFSLIGCKLGLVGKKKYDKIAKCAAIVILLVLCVKCILL